MNEYDTHTVLSELVAGGHSVVDVPADADLIILNTCAVRGKPVEKVVTMLGELRKQKLAGRDLTEERVRELGDGRTYTGEQAAENGLVDELGGLEQAAAEARGLANIQQAQVVRYEESPGLFESVQARIAPEEPEAVQIMESAGIEPTPEMQYLYRPGW